MGEVSVVVVHYRGVDILHTCLASLGGEHEVVVVDNGSTDGSREMVEADFPAVRLLPLGHNAGFAAGANAGVGAASSPWVLVANDDTTFEADAVTELLAAARAAPDAFSLAAQLRFASTPGMINSAGLSVDRWGAARDRLVGQPPAMAGEPLEVFGASAGAALYHRGRFLEIDGFDETFGAYLEDVDLAWRAQMRGWRSHYVPTAVVHHHVSATSGHRSQFKHYHVGRNRVRMLAKNMDGANLRRSLPVILAYETGHAVYATVADRTLAPVRGRIAGLRDWRALRAAHAGSRRPVELDPPAGIRSALERRRAFGRWGVEAYR